MEHLEFLKDGVTTTFYVPLGKNSKEMQLMIAVMGLFEGNGDIDVNTKARVANYINERFGLHVEKAK